MLLLHHCRKVSKSFKLWWRNRAMRKRSLDASLSINRTSTVTVSSSPYETMTTVVSIHDENTDLWTHTCCAVWCDNVALYNCPSCYVLLQLHFFYFTIKLERGRGFRGHIYREWSFSWHSQCCSHNCRLSYHCVPACILWPRSTFMVNNCPSPMYICYQFCGRGNQIMVCIPCHLPQFMHGC